jgi:hypothetical protein
MELNDELDDNVSIGSGSSGVIDEAPGKSFDDAIDDDEDRPRSNRSKKPASKNFDDDSSSEEPHSKFDDDF